MRLHQELQPLFQRAASRCQTLGPLRGATCFSHEGIPGAERTGHSHRATSDACDYTGSSSTLFLQSLTLLTTNTTALQVQRCHLSSWPHCTARDVVFVMLLSWEHQVIFLKCSFTLRTCLFCLNQRSQYQKRNYSILMVNFALAGTAQFSKLFPVVRVLLPVNCNLDFFMQEFTNIKTV